MTVALPIAHAATMLRVRCARAALALVLALMACAVTAQEDPIAAGKAAQAAAAAAAAAAQAAQQAANSGEQAANSSKGTSATATQDANADHHADNAATAAKNAAANAETARAAAEAALKAARDAQAAAQKGDAAAAQTAADKAKAAADKAKGEADKAKGEADKAAQADNQAQQLLKNDQLNNNVKTPTQAEKDKYKDQQEAADEYIEQEQFIEKDMPVNRRQARDLEKAAIEFRINLEEKEELLQPPDKRAVIPTGVTSFFDVFFELTPPLQLPNAQAPSAVPDIGSLPGSQIELFVLLFNGNDFDLLLTGVTGHLFGDAVSFTPFVGTQVVPAGGSALVEIGAFDYLGPVHAFTAADISFLTGADQPGLGAELMVNFSVVPEPGGLGLLGLTACVAALSARRRRPARFA